MLDHREKFKINLLAHTHTHTIIFYVFHVFYVTYMYNVYGMYRFTRN